MDLNTFMVTMFCIIDDWLADKKLRQRGQQPYKRIDQLAWPEYEQEHGKTLHIKDFPKGHRVKLFRLVRSTERTNYIATNDVAQASTQGTQEVYALRWKVEQFHLKPSKSRY